MSDWQGERRISVATAYVKPDGAPDFALNEVEVTHEEYLNGVHIDIVENILAASGFEEPLIHFDSIGAPSFLIPAVKAHLEPSPVKHVDHDAVIPF